MKKRISIIILCVLISAGAVLCLVGCGDKGGGVPPIDPIIGTWIGHSTVDKNKEIQYFMTIEKTGKDHNDTLYSSSITRVIFNKVEHSVDKETRLEQNGVRQSVVNNKTFYFCDFLMQDFSWSGSSRFGLYWLSITNDEFNLQGSAESDYDVSGERYTFVRFYMTREDWLDTVFVKDKDGNIALDENGDAIPKYFQ